MKHLGAMFRPAMMLAVLGASLFIDSPVLSFSTVNTHPALTAEIAELFNRKSKQPFSEQEIGWLRQGATEEDEPMRYINHFYDPVHKTGWSGKHFGYLSQAEGLAMGADTAPRPPLSAPDWADNQAAQASYGRQYGNQTWQKAVKAYLDRDKKSSFIALGHTLHLIEDMAVPDHTRDDTHAGIKGDPGSPFEDYSKDYTNYNQLTIAQGLANQPLPVFDNLQQAFVSLANYSNKNFFSEDTISNEEFRKPNIESLQRVEKMNEDGVRVYLYDDGVYLAYEKMKGHDRFYSTNDKSFVLPSYRDHLFPQAVLTGAGVIDLFFRDAEKYRQHPESLPAITADANQPFLQALKATPKLAVLKVNDTWDRSSVAAQVFLANSVGLAKIVATTAKDTVTDVLQKVKLVAVAPTSTPPPKTTPLPLLEKEGIVLGEQVEAEKITNNQTPITKKEEKKEPEKKPVAKAEIAAPSKADRNDKVDSVASLQNDSGGPDDLIGDSVALPAESAGSLGDETLTPPPEPPLTPPWKGGDLKVAPTRPAGPSFIGVFAPSNPHPTLSLEGRGDDNTPIPPPPTPAPPAPDTIAPTTWITILPATTTAASFLVQWSGTDNVQPTPASYDIQYQTITPVSSTGQVLGGSATSSPSYPWQVGAASFNINDWLDWLLATSTASSYFTGQDERTYGFRSRGRDTAGNQSVYPSTAEAHTYLNLSAPNAPTVTSHQNNQTLTYGDDIATSTTGVQITLAGTSDPNDTINITYSSSTAASTTASSLGAWSSLLTLSEGANTISLQSQEADNDTSSSTNITLNLNTAPSTVTNLSVITASTTATSTALAWTTPTQANLNIAGSAAYYDVRYVSGPSCAINDSSFTGAVSAPNPPVPSSESGLAESFIIGNLTETTAYCFGLKTFNGSRTSDLSNIASITLPSAHGTDISQTATSTNKDWGWNNTGSWRKIAQSFQPTRASINGFDFTMCRRYPDGYGVPGLRVILCRGLPNSTYLGGCDPGNAANNVLYRKDYTSAETQAMMPFCGGWAGVPARILPPVINFSFSATALTPGQTYSIILSIFSSADMEPFQSSYQATGNPYGNGAIYYQDDNTWFKEKVGADWYFKTLY